MSKIEPVTMYKDSEGQLHPSEEAAKVANGLNALRRRLHEQGGSPPAVLNKSLADLKAWESDATFTLDEVMRNFQDWYLLYLEASK